MYELREFQTRIAMAKRDLKEIYYTTRDEGKKADSKRLVVTIISLEKTAERLIELRRKTKTSRRVLDDRKAKLNLKKWSIGLPKRVRDLKDKQKLEYEHFRRFLERLEKYIEEILDELNSWVVDIETLADLPRPPKD